MSDSKTFLEVTGAAIVAGTIVVVGILFGRRKNKADINKTNAETKLTSITATEMELDFYKTLLADFKEETEKLRASVITYRQENENLHIEVERVKKQNIELTKQIDELIKENNILLGQLKNTSHE